MSVAHAPQSISWTAIPQVDFAMDECRPFLEAPPGVPPRLGKRVTFLSDGHANIVVWIQYCWLASLNHSFMSITPETRTAKQNVSTVWERLVSVVEQYSREVEIATGVGAAQLDEPSGMEMPVDTPTLRSGEIVMPWTFVGRIRSRPAYRRLCDACPSIATTMGDGVALRPVAVPGETPAAAVSTALAESGLRYLDPLCG